MLFLFLTSLAFKLIRSYPKCLEDKFANVVFPIPGGPTRSNGLTPFFHFANHSTNDFRASSFPIKSRICRRAIFFRPHHFQSLWKIR